MFFCSSKSLLWDTHACTMSFPLPKCSFDNKSLTQGQPTGTYKLKKQSGYTNNYRELLGQWNRNKSPLKSENYQCLTSYWQYTEYVMDLISIRKWTVISVCNLAPLKKQTKCGFCNTVILCTKFPIFYLFWHLN